jgi:hypothetical protein
LIWAQFYFSGERVLFLGVSESNPQRKALILTASAIMPTQTIARAVRHSATPREVSERRRFGILVRLAAALSPALLFLAGCGGVGLSQGAGMSQLAVHAVRATVDTNTSDQFSARLSSGAPATVTWSIAGGENDASIGQGTISAAGLYVPPAMLSRDSITVEVRATLASDPSTSATYSLAVTPGFVQPLTPENASLAPGGAVRVTGEIAELNGGSIQWSVLPLPNTAGAQSGAVYGSLSKIQCSHSPQTYTYCSAMYTAPSSMNGNNSSFNVVASLPNNAEATAMLHVLLNGGGFNSSALQNQAAQTGSVEMGSSGGNANDYDSSQDANGDRYVNDCCGGTLGALVQDRNNNLYILSNNHVLAESDQARPGDTVVQPALIDSNCNPQAGQTVGALRYAVPLQSSQTNADAALAAATPAVDPSGAILQLGSAVHGALSPAAPATGMGEALTAGTLNQLRVVKSGRTTGLTCSTVNTVNLSVQVDYYYDCAETQPLYTKTYTNQIGIPGAGFADSGDSGALVMDASNAEAIGLLFASGAGENDTGFSVANPIQDVLSELDQNSAGEGQQFQVVGGAPHPVTCTNYDPNRARIGANLSAAQLSAARSAADTASALLLRPDNGILDIGTGKSLDRPEEAAILVYVDKNRTNVAIPKLIDGVRTVVIQTDEAGASEQIPPGSPAQGIHLPAEVLRAAAQIQQQYAPKLMSDPAFFGVGVTQSYDNPAEAALLVLVDPRKPPESMPEVIGDLRVRYLRINRLHVTRSKYSTGRQPTSCQLRASRR